MTKEQFVRSEDYRSRYIAEHPGWRGQWYMCPYCGRFVKKDRITIYDVLTLGGAQQVGTPSRKGEIKVLCPHGVKTSRGKTATFDVNLAKSNFK